MIFNRLVGVLLLAVAVAGRYENGRERPPVELLIVPDTESEGRLLSVADGPHGLRIYGHYLENTIRSPSLEAIRTIFSIATNYFKRTLKVNSLPPEMTKFPATKSKGLLQFLIGSTSSNPCNSEFDTGVTYASSQYKSSGFDQNSTDMVVFVDTENKPKESYVAYAMECAFARRPIYGLIMYNAAYVNLRPLSQLHLAIQVTMHELIHVLGFSTKYYDQFYVSPNSNMKLPQSSVVRKFGNKTMVVTPRVMQYVQEFFGCSDQRTGAMLENQGDSGNIGSHWEKLIYRNQLMTPSSESAGFRVTQLTLALLEDTGFYASVDYSMAEPNMWGYKKGCSFAQGLSQELQYDCMMNPEMSCDYDSRYVRSCKVAKFTDGVKVESAYKNEICANSQNSNQPTTRFAYYGDESRCLIAGTSNTPTCYRAVCTPDGRNVVINVGSSTGTCTMPGQQLSIQGVLVNCPKDFTLFCVYRSCPNWCNGHGVCINGNCVCAPPWGGSGCSEGCPVLYDSATDMCINECRPGSYILNNVCLSICPNGYVGGSDRRCQPCYSKCPGAVAGKFSTRLLGLVLGLIAFFAAM